jgi:hypothetical protein
MDRALATQLDVSTVGPSGATVEERWSVRNHRAGEPAREPAAKRQPPLQGACWSPLPSEWILNGGLRTFREDLAHAGRSTAALKLLTVVVIATGSGRFAAPDDGLAAQITHDELNMLAGLSRPLVVAAKKFLSAEGIVDVTQDASTGRTVYRLDGRASLFGSIHHASALADGSTSAIASLRKLSCRQATTLRAMKVYMLLSGLRRGDAESVFTSRAEIVQLTGLRDSHVEVSLAELKKRNMIVGDLRSIRACAGDDRITVRTLPLN